MKPKEEPKIKIEVVELYKDESIAKPTATDSVPYPKRVFLILGNEFCERFNFFGMRAILVLYLKNNLGYSEDNATILYHGSSVLMYFLSIFGGIISDVWLGRFKTIFILSIVHSVGSIIIAMSSITVLNLPSNTILILGMIFISIGVGGIKPCVPAFGADQFKLPQQIKQSATFFSLFYCTVNIAALISATSTPMLKSEVHCFGQNECFPLAFGMPAILMIIATFMFLVGRSSYTHKALSSENILVLVVKCIVNAIKTRIREGRSKLRKNLLDYSIEKYGQKLVEDTRILLKILLLYAPLPLFWTLYEQVGSRWTLQANRMDGNIGFYQILPDQIQVINALLVLVFIPLFDFFVYPLLSKIGIRRPLQKITIGGFFTAVAFAIAAFVEFRIESSTDKSVSMLWQIPQYIVITIAEIMFNVTGYKFSYEQAPDSMKSVVLSFWLLTMAFGNLILLFIVDLSLFASQAHEFLLFAGLMFIDMMIFMYLAHNFKPRKRNLDQ